MTDDGPKLISGGKAEVAYRAFCQTEEYRQAFYDAERAPGIDNAFWTVFERGYAACEAERDAKAGALDLATDMIMDHEPGDSRAVSNEAVAIAAVACGIGTKEDAAIIRAALASRAMTTEAK